MLNCFKKNGGFMKKFIYFVLSLILIVSMFFIPIKNTNFINVMAESLNYTVNFYRGDTVVHSHSVPAGTPLNSVNVESASYPGYTELSYVQANGSQYIDLGLSASSNVTVDIDFMFTTVTDYATILGARGSNSSRIYPIRLQDKKFAIGYGSTQNSIYSSSVTAVANTRYFLHSVCIPNNQSLTLNNSSILNRTSSSSYSTNNNFYLFANNNQGSAEYFCNVRIYSFKLYTNSTLIFDFVPVKRNFDNSVGFFNKVDNTFYSSSSSSSLVAGSVTGSNYSLSLYDYLKLNNNVNVWFDSFGNAYNWSTPVTSDLNLYYSSSVKSYNDSTFSIVDDKDVGLNYYNKESLKYVSINNLTINTIPFNSLIYFGKFTGPLTESDLLQTTDIYTVDNDYFSYSYNVKYVIDTVNNYFYSYLINFNYEVKQNIPLKEFEFEAFYFNHTNFEYILFEDFYMLEIIDSISFDYVFNNQYIYNSTFGFSFESSFFEEDSILSSYFTTTDGGGYINFIDNKNNYFNSNFNNSLYDSADYFLINSNSLNSNYINSIYLDFNESIYFFNDDVFYPESPSPFVKNYVFSGSYINAPALFSGGYNEDSLSSTIIPVDSNDLYRPAEWYDIPAQLYNFMIWLIFDAPLISQFAELVYILIRFIISSFSIIISLFGKVNNSMFLGLFLGFIVLSFVFKIIFGGSKSD